MDQSSTPLAEIRRRLALLVGENAVFDGWTTAAVDNAAATMEVDPAVARLAFPKDAAGLIGAYVDGVDQALVDACGGGAMAELRTPARIRALVLQRLEIMEPAREAVRTALAILAMPQNLAAAAKLGWRSADMMWRLAGDTATDFNHYSKRAILSSLYAATLLVWINDQSDGDATTKAFLERRLADVGRFERFKADWRRSDRHLSLSRFVGRLRYPPR